MLDFTRSNRIPKTSYDNICYEYEHCISDLIQNSTVLSMNNYIHHSSITCLEHSISVSYNSFSMCKRLGLDSRSAARGGLLHDLFLYDWHVTKPDKGLHGFTHPYAALENAVKHFYLNDKEKDIIVKHMWPLTVKSPKFKESAVVCLMDKYCATKEILRVGNNDTATMFMRKYCSIRP